MAHLATYPVPLSPLVFRLLCAVQYVLFVYPSAEEGPRAPGSRAVMVYHK